MYLKTAENTNYETNNSPNYIVVHKKQKMTCKKEKKCQEKKRNYKSIHKNMSSEEFMV